MKKENYKNCFGCEHAIIEKNKWVVCRRLKGNICGNREQTFPYWKPRFTSQFFSKQEFKV